MNLSLRATKILKVPNIAIKTLVNLIDFIFFKFLVKISVKIDDAVNRLVSAEEITAESNPKYSSKLTNLGSLFAATCSNGDSPEDRLGKVPAA